MRSIRVLLVEDHTLVREGLKALLEREPDLEVVGEAAEGQQALRLARERQPDVVVMDVNLPGLSGFQTARAIHTAHPRIQILALTMHESNEYVFGMLKAGAKGYILKQSAAEELAEAIRTVARDQSVLSPAIARTVIEEFNRHDLSAHPNDELTERERDILRLMATGKTSREIGSELGLSAKTVDNYRARILDKLQARNRVEAIAFALQRGLIQPAALTPVG